MEPWNFGENGGQAITHNEMKKLLILFAAILMVAGLNTHAQSTNATPAELEKLLERIHAKIDAGKNTEADYTNELKDFDDLIAVQHGAKNDDTAQIIYLKYELYVEVLGEIGKGRQVILQLKRDYPDTQAGKAADDILASLNQLAAGQRIQDALTAGSTFPDFEERDLNDKAISVAGYKGKVVLVDFWATWCVLCQVELPNVIATYKRHHADGLEIIGVSLDSDRGRLDEFLKQNDGMNWQQIFDGQGWNNKLAVKYGVEDLPFNVLVGPDGRIIGKGLSGEKLEAAVAGALAKKQ